MWVLIALVAGAIGHAALLYLLLAYPQSICPEQAQEPPCPTHS